MTGTKRFGAPYRTQNGYGIRRLLGVLESKPTYKDIEAIMAESSLDTCPEAQPHRLQA